MRLIMFIAVALLVVAFVCAVVPTAALGLSAFGWLVAGLLAWAIDVLLGGFIYSGFVRRGPE